MEAAAEIRNKMASPKFPVCIFHYRDGFIGIAINEEDKHTMLKNKDGVFTCYWIQAIRNWSLLKSQSNIQEHQIDYDIELACT